MPSDLQKAPENLNAAVIAAIGLVAAGGIFYLLTHQGLYFVISAVVVGLIYWLVYSKLTTDIATAKTSAFAMAIFVAIDFVAGLINSATLPALGADAAIAGCLGYAAAQLQEMERSRSPTPPPMSMPSAGISGPAAPDAVEQLKKLGELRATGILSDAEFEAKKAELLRRI
jgi:hypothetical protein